MFLDKVWTREERGRLEDCSSPSSKLKRLLFSDSPTLSDSQSEQESPVSSKSPSFSMGESSNSKSNELKELLQTLVVGQTQLRENIQQIFQYLLSREPQVTPGGSNTENKVLVSTNSPMTESEKRLLQRVEQMEKQYRFNNEVDVTMRDLETTKQGAKETFSSFITRWRAKAVQMTSRPSEEDQLQMVVKNLLPTYNKHLFAQYFLTFKALVAA
ncbi:retrotransposon gag domain-containing protein, partial [Fagus crenata]